jgi:hypothetical protein
LVGDSLRNLVSLAGVGCDYSVITVIGRSLKAITLIGKRYLLETDPSKSLQKGFVIMQIGLQILQNEMTDIEYLFLLSPGYWSM